MMPYTEQVALANVLARKIDEQLPDGTGFCLLLFPTNAPLGSSMSTYIANIQRDGVHSELRGLVAKWDADELAKASPQVRPILPTMIAAGHLRREINALDVGGAPDFVLEALGNAQTAITRLYKAFGYQDPNPPAEGTTAAPAAEKE